jgi:ribosomal protein L20A (L18A)
VILIAISVCDFDCFFFFFPPCHRYFLSQLRKMKKSTGEILSCGRITERNENSVRIYGIWVRYNSRSGTHNIYKEYRDTALDGAVNQMFEEMASRNRARRGSIQILRWVWGGNGKIKIKKKKKKKKKGLGEMAAEWLLFGSRLVEICLFAVRMRGTDCYV